MAISLANLKSKLQGVFPNIQTITGRVTDFIRGNPIVSTASVGAGSALVASAVTAYAGRRKRKKSTRKKSTTKRKKRKGRKSKSRTKRKGRRTPRTAGKGRDRSTKRIRYTKKGQPYVITRSGKAKFIKKSSAKRSHKRKGGRY